MNKPKGRPFYKNKLIKRGRLFLHLSHLALDDALLEYKKKPKRAATLYFISKPKTEAINHTIITLEEQKGNSLADVPLKLPEFDETIY